jgi:S-adenosylmethionine:tRNA ribosyltransferase-isomerase
MKISDFDYDLPDELIAQEPADERDASRMLVVDRRRGVWQDSHFLELPSLLNEKDLLVINNTRVFPARLIGHRDVSGGKVELFLIREREEQIWEALARPARRLNVGERIRFTNDNGEKDLLAEIIEVLDDGKRLVRFEADESIESVIDSIGQVPLPPYIKRDSEESFNRDKERYQTIYASKRGAIAAPTAGLHFTPKILDQIRVCGASIVEITLHVGYGTFEPVRVEDVNEHSVSAEHYEIGEDVAEKIEKVKAAGGRVVAIGTTTTRALESATDNNRIKPGSGVTELTIKPGYQFKIVDALITNFHLPQSSLLMLVATFAGYKLTLDAYRHAVRERYRFYSYGDCMFIS